MLFLLWAGPQPPCSPRWRPPRPRWGHRFTQTASCSLCLSGSGGQSSAGDNPRHVAVSPPVGRVVVVVDVDGVISPVGGQTAWGDDVVAGNVFGPVYVSPTLCARLDALGNLPNVQCLLLTSWTAEMRSGMSPFPGRRWEEVAEQPLRSTGRLRHLIRTWSDRKPASVESPGVPLSALEPGLTTEQAENRDPAPRSGLSFAGQPAGEMMYPLVPRASRHRRPHQGARDGDVPGTEDRTPALLPVAGLPAP